MSEDIKNENLNSVDNPEIKKETVDETADPNKGEKNDNPEGDKGKDNTKPDYRPKAGSDSVPLSKYTKVKQRIKELKAQLEERSNLSNQDLESLAKEYNFDDKVLAKIATIIKRDTLKEAEKKIAPILSKQQQVENEKRFDEDFERAIAKKYPELAGKKGQFKRIAFSPDFIHLKTLEDIRKEFYPEITSKTKDDTPEAGSNAAPKETETIDFSKMTEEQHLRVLADPKLKAKYYAWQDAQG
jgi:hypothetical protein